MDMPLLNKQAGHFLLAVLIFIHLLSMVTLYELSTLKNQLQFASLFWHIKEDELLSNEVVVTIENKLDNIKKSCIILPQSSDELRRLSRDWWHQFGCRLTLSGRSYQYVIEKIQHDPCAILTHQDDVSGITYYRISVLRNDSSSILQTITAVSDVTETCKGQKHIRKLGRHSWREF